MTNWSPLPERLTGIDDQRDDVGLGERGPDVIHHPHVQPVQRLVDPRRIEKRDLPPGIVEMPTIRLRVVCGLAETIETLWPRTRLSSVDLPALGRPVRATTPKGGDAPAHARSRTELA